MRNECEIDHVCTHSHFAPVFRVVQNASQRQGFDHCAFNSNRKRSHKPAGIPSLYL